MDTNTVGPGIICTKTGKHCPILKETTVINVFTRAPGMEYLSVPCSCRVGIHNLRVGVLVEDARSLGCKLARAGDYAPRRWVVAREKELGYRLPTLDVVQPITPIEEEYVADCKVGFDEALQALLQQERIAPTLPPDQVACIEAFASELQVTGTRGINYALHQVNSLAGTTLDDQTGTI